MLQERVSSLADVAKVALDWLQALKSAGKTKVGPELHARSHRPPTRYLGGDSHNPRRASMTGSVEFTVEYTYMVKKLRHPNCQHGRSPPSLTTCPTTRNETRLDPVT